MPSTADHAFALSRVRSSARASARRATIGTNSTVPSALGTYWCVNPVFTRSNARTARPPWTCPRARGRRRGARCARDLWHGVPASIGLTADGCSLASLTRSREARIPTARESRGRTDGPRPRSRARTRRAAASCATRSFEAITRGTSRRGRSDPAPADARRSSGSRASTSSTMTSLFASSRTISGPASRSDLRPRGTASA